MSKKIIVITLLSIFFSITFWPLFTTQVEATIIRVPKDVPTIQLAINIAYPGDTIQVSAGTYYEHVVVNKSVTLTGQDISTTIIDGNGTGYVVYITASNVHISGFTIQNGDRGIYLKYSTGSIISNNTVSNNRVGIYLSINSTNNSVTTNTITSNDDYGIRAYKSSNNTINGNTVSSNYRGISLSYSNSNIISGNIVSTNRYGIKVYRSSENTLDNNVVSNNYYGIYISSNSSGNTISGNTVTSNNYYGIRLSDSNSCTLSSNTVTGSRYGIRLWYSGGCVMRNNQMSENNYNFWVYGRSVTDYIQDIDTSNTVEGKPIYYVVNKADWEVPSDAGYVAVINSTNIAVRNLILTNNYHGVLFAYATSSTIENVETSYNVYGIKLFSSKGVTITGSTVSFNKDFGIRLYRSNSTTISGNTIESNARYGVYLYYSSLNILISNTLTGNKYNFGVDGDFLLDYIQDIDTSNTVDGKPIYYWVNQHDRQVPVNAGYVGIINSTGITVRDLTLAKNEHGVLFAYTNSSTIENVYASDNQRGIDIQHSNDNTMSGNTVTSSIYGIYFYSSMNNILINNNMLNNTYNFGVYGTSLSHFIHNIDASNMVDGKPIYYWVNQHDRQVPANAGYVAAINSTNITVKDLTLINNYQGVLFAYTTGSTIQNMNASSNRFGIYLDYSNGNTITSNTIFKNRYRGIYFYRSNSNAINDNMVTLNEVGVKIHWYSTDNIIRGNAISKNDLGVSLDTSSNNKIYHNNFINNTDQAYQDASSFNIWDNGAGQGNYWTDYTGEDLNGDGVGDTLLPHLGLDYYPLMVPWTAPHPPPIHDIAITNVWPSNATVTPGEIIYIYVIVENQGDFNETFTVTASYTLRVDPIIGTQTVTLASGASTTLTFIWDTTGLSGRYTINATVSVVSGETETADNSYTNGTVCIGSQDGMSGGSRHLLFKT